MSYDDIASSSDNPFPGKLYNKPTAQGIPGVDVYEGCKIDYSGLDVTPENFLAIITGDEETATGKVKSLTLQHTHITDESDEMDEIFELGPYKSDEMDEDEVGEVEAGESS
eukprot:1314523-Amorphochlora_amoeboformis.AAC.2